MGKIYLYSVIILLTNQCLAQNSQTEDIKYFFKSKDSVISKFLSSRIDTTNYRCAYEESNELYIFISQNKCYIYSKYPGHIDSLSNKFIFKIPRMQTIRKNKIDSFLNNSENSGILMEGFILLLQM